MNPDYDFAGLLPEDGEEDTVQSDIRYDPRTRRFYNGFGMEVDFTGRPIDVSGYKEPNQRALEHLAHQIQRPAPAARSAPAQVATLVPSAEPPLALPDQPKTKKQKLEDQVSAARPLGSPIGATHAVQTLLGRSATPTSDLVTQGKSTGKAKPWLHTYQNVGVLQSTLDKGSQSNFWMWAFTDMVPLFDKKNIDEVYLGRRVEVAGGYYCILTKNALTVQDMYDVLRITERGPAKYREALALIDTSVLFPAAPPTMLEWMQKARLHPLKLEI